MSGIGLDSSLMALTSRCSLQAGWSTSLQKSMPSAAVFIQLVSLRPSGSMASVAPFSPAISATPRTTSAARLVASSRSHSGRRLRAFGLPQTITFPPRAPQKRAICWPNFIASLRSIASGVVMCIQAGLVSSQCRPMISRPNDFAMRVSRIASATVRSRGSSLSENGASSSPSNPHAAAPSHTFSKGALPQCSLQIANRMTSGLTGAERQVNGQKPAS